MTIPVVEPIVVPLPSLGHRKFCVAGLARGHPDSGEAAIMGVPLPHLVLPLSGCLSRHTPTRATRGEARGHRSALAQNSLLMYPLLFPPFGLVVGLVCPRHMVDWPNVFALLCRDVGALVHSRCQWWCDPLGNNGSCEVVCVNRGRPTHIGYPRRSGRVGRMRVRSFHIHLWVCVVAVMGLCDRRFGPSWRHPIDT